MDVFWLTAVLFVFVAAFLWRLLREERKHRGVRGVRL